MIKDSELNRVMRNESGEFESDVNQRFTEGSNNVLVQPFMETTFMYSDVRDYRSETILAR